MRYSRTARSRRACAALAALGVFAAPVGAGTAFAAEPPVPAPVVAGAVPAAESDFPSPHAHGYTVQTASGKLEDSTDWNPSWGWAAGAMISDLQDMRSWARTVATGTLLTPKTQAERLKTYPSGVPGAGYGLGIFDIQGWIGHNGSLPGYESLTLYLPESQATLVVLLSTDVLHDNIEPSTLFGQAITRIVAPDHVFDIPVVAPPPSPKG